jgi:FixJ family two-component response regulator
MSGLFLSKRELVFVVDDDPAMLRGVARVLKQHGYETILFALLRLSEATTITKTRLASF